MAEKSTPETRYERYRRRRWEERIAASRAQAAADATIKRLTLPEAIHRAGHVLFGSDWIGPISPQERAVLRQGDEAPDYAEVARRDRERDAQMSETERWLLVEGLVETPDGVWYVRETALADALVAYTGERRRGAKLTKRQAIRDFVDRRYPNGIPPHVKLTSICEDFQHETGLAIDERTLRRALGRK